MTLFAIFTDPSEDQDTTRETLKLTQEDMDKIACWIDLALPHSGAWTEGMTPEDKEIYMTVYQKRVDQEKQEALNVQAHIQAQNEN